MDHNNTVDQSKPNIIKVQIDAPLIDKPNRDSEEISPSNKPIIRQDDEIKEVINKFKYLDEPFSSAQFKRIVKDTFTLIPKSTLIGFAFSLTPLQNAVGYYIMNQKGETGLQGAFGLYTMFRALLYTAMFHGITLRMSISASQCFGKGEDMAIGKKYFTQAFMVYLLYFTFIYYPFTMLSENILVAINITEDIASDFKQIAVKCLANDFFDVIQQFIMEYCYSQNIESIFSPIGWTNFAVSIVISLVLGLTYDYGFDGWIIGRTIYYILNIIAFLFVYYTKTNKRSRGLVPLSVAMDGFGDFVGGCFSFYLGNVFEWIGWEIGIYFNALSHDNTQIAAFGAATSVVSFTYHYGLGFLVVGRTRINYLLGAGHYKSAKKIAAMIIFAGFIAATITGVLLFIFKAQIAQIYSSNNKDSLDYLVKLLTLYCVFLQVDVNYGSIITVMRSTNHVIFCAVACFVCCFIFNGTGCIVMLKTIDIKCTHIFMSMYVSMAIALVICLLKGFSYDWANVKTTGEKKIPSFSVLGDFANDPKIMAVRSKLASVLVNAK